MRDELISQGGHGSGPQLSALHWDSGCDVRVSRLGGEREGGNVPGAAGRQIERDNLRDSVDKTNMQ